MSDHALSSLEIAAGTVFGACAAADTHLNASNASAADLDGATSEAHAVERCVHAEPRQALERAILPALLRPPCLVSFSGGHDSSVVLAAAVSLARREGLAPPVPATNVFRAAPDADEQSWQEQVITHLGLTDWLRFEHTDELDLIGPYAQRVLVAHGLLWPPNVHFHLPLLDAASGGSLLTGIGGDELFAAARWPRASALLSGSVRPRPRDVLSVGLAIAPLALRQAVIARRNRVEAEWLRARARRLASARFAAQSAAEPRKLAERMAWWRRLRYLHVGASAIELTAKDTNTLLGHPLLSASLWRGVAHVAAPVGFRTRIEGTRRLFGDMLPAGVISRSSKAHFDDAFWTAHSHAFARGWDRSGVPEEWVEARALSNHWLGERPSAQSFTLLQAAWLASTARSHRGGTAVSPARSPRHAVDEAREPVASSARAGQ